MSNASSLPLPATMMMSVGGMLAAGADKSATSRPRSSSLQQQLSILSLPSSPRRTLCRAMHVSWQSGVKEPAEPYQPPAPSASPTNSYLSLAEYDRLRKKQQQQQHGRHKQRQHHAAAGKKRK
eukprot:TRINITY_DN858_c0_g2_i2.p5 TRINITY_DN858_c0_g2~~TRINITY_DN858_c0_g2_i2.p5  ORF type:complete len:135 (+),score=70.91 TRINITY_DN858_c0_g2_i2:38-406(+)